ncbi:hypothetical protein [Kitasatospora sp. NPDC059599]|uniref:hypothetical protein n=1 Tax=Kitasatospora sp. NPDC059599 TaxID=3346880 RepID=UPI0036880E54
MTVVDKAWERLGSQLGSAEFVAMLRRLAGGEPADGQAVFHALYSDRRGMSALAPDALPFVLALARDPALPAREELVLALHMLVGCARSQPEERIAPGWPSAWRACRAAAEPLVSDPDPTVRRWAVSLVERRGLLLDRLRAEPEPALRIRLLLRLGRVAAPSDDEARAAVAAEADDDAPALRLAALRALNRLDPDGAAGRVDQLVEVFTGPTTPSSVDLLWNPLAEEYPVELADLILPAAEELPGEVAARFTARLARTGAPEFRVAALDAAWRVLAMRPSAGPGLIPAAGELLDDPDPRIRTRAAHLLAVLARRAAPFADRLFALLDDRSGDDLLDGDTADFAHWALARMGDPRVMPGLVQKLTELEEEQGRGYIGGDPRRPEPYDALIALAEHADVLRPALTERVRAGRRGADVLAVWDGLSTAGDPSATPDPESVVGRLRRMPQHYQPWQDLRPQRAAMAAVAALSRRGPLPPEVRAAVECVLALDRRLSDKADYRAVLDDERLRGMLERALRGEAVRMPALSGSLPFS